MLMSSLSITLRRWWHYWLLWLVAIFPACASPLMQDIGDASYKIGYAVCSDDDVTSAELDSTLSAIADGAVINYVAGCEAALNQ